jgi:hypothetical protein
LVAKAREIQGNLSFIGSEGQNQGRWDRDQEWGVPGVHAVHLASATPSYARHQPAMACVF